MLTRRRFFGYSALSSAMLACPSWLRSALGQTSAGRAQRPLRLAILGSVYHLGSNLQTIGDRFLVGYPYEGEWHMPDVQVVSMYVDRQVRKSNGRPTEFARAMGGEVADYNRLKPSRRHPPIAHGAQEPHPSEQLGPETDLSESRSQQFGFRLCRNIPEALRCGGSRIAVDAVLAIAEQGVNYPYSSNDMGQILLPTYDWFQQCAHVFEDEHHAVPYFNHKQLSFSFPEAQNMVETAERLKFPLLAGSSMPVTWRLPDVDIPLGAPVEEAVMVGVGRFDGMDFDALDAMQSMLERRKGGETGVKAVQLLEGDDVWAARKAGRWSEDLMSSALSRSDTPLGLTVLDGRTQDLAAPDVLPQLVKDPAAYCIEYNDGTRATLLMLNGAIRDFNISVRVQGHGMVSTQFFMPPAPNQTYSACLAAKIEQMYQTRRAPYPVERTLLTTGLLEACLNSRHRLNQRLETPQLSIRYRPPAESQYARS
ncbi:MAG TPA: hypothetical protein VFN62_08345 [Acidobacteriaceae bacterium]|nr:hypothetical protein [Acidobacteriaceae bacterium]